MIKVRNKSQKSGNDNSIEKNIEAKIAKIRNELGNSSDLIVQLSKTAVSEDFQYACIYINNLVDKKSLNSLASEIIQISKENKGKTPDDFFYSIMKSLSITRDTEESSEYDKLYEYLLSGYIIFLFNGCDVFFAINITSAEGRTIEEPTTQSVIRGPKEGFIEKIDVNISLVRRIVKSKALRVEDLTLGSITKTKISLMYIDKIAKKDIVDEIRRRLNEIKIDGILDSGNIEELTKDDRYSIFPEFLNSEKPDSIAAQLLEGRVAIFVDGSSYVLTAPALFVEFLQVSEDYYHHFLVSTFIRMLRYVAAFLTLFVPALFISIVTFHQEMIPTPLLINIAAQREGIPFPAFIEAMLMEVVFEILREAGIRMPRVIGPAISIVGALVLGQAAVEAGIVSAFMVIIVSITAISSFAIPNYSMAYAVRLIRFALMVLAGMYGLYGVFMGSIALLLHLCKLKSIGIPYMIPIAPKTKYATKDTIIRYPLWLNKTRPAGISGANLPRVDADNVVTKKEKENPEFR